MRAHGAVFFASAMLLLGRLAAAHGNESSDLDENAQPMESYFRHPRYFGWNLMHTILMMIAWVISMPLAIMLSVARSRYSLPAQILFHVLNGLGTLTAVVYNTSTPDLYPSNSHHGLGWAVFAFTIVWTITSFVTGRVHTDKQKMSFTGFLRRSSDSVYASPGLSTSDDCSDNASDRDLERPLLAKKRIDRLVSKNARQRTLKILRLCQIVLEKFLLLLGFAALASGFIVSGGLFRDRHVFNGIAHYIKGGIFVWYGILTFGRWMGAFAEFGWAWNVRPQGMHGWKARVPSAEFTESFVIWAYGASNVFLEHLSGWGKEWTPTDLEHLSITILFFGGGLLGMLVESDWVNDLATASLDNMTGRKGTWEKPKEPRTSLNPMPALTIMLMGTMMASHHQKSMVSTMLHAQWGGLFSAFALARGATYITLYLKAPTSQRARPPSEIIASFCLLAGGLVFMNSAEDVVWAIESNGLDAMTVFTVCMGLTGILLSWELVLYAIKCWAVRTEGARLSCYVAVDGSQ